MGGAKVHLHSFLTPTLDGGERLTSHPGCFTPDEPPYPLNGRLGGPQSWSGRFEKESLAFLRIETPYRPARSLVTIPTGWFKMQRDYQQEGKRDGAQWLFRQNVCCHISKNCKGLHF